MTLNRSRSSRITAIALGLVRADARERVGDPVGQQLAVRQPGRRVVEGAALRDVDQPRVVEGDRGELGEPGQRIDLARAPNVRSVEPDARPMTPTTSSPELSGTPTIAPSVRGGTIAGRAGRRRRSRRPRAGWPVRKTCAAEAFVDRLAVADALGEEAGAVAEDERRRRPARRGRCSRAASRAARGAGQDRLEQRRRSRAGRAAPGPSRRARAGTGRAGARAGVGDSARPASRGTSPGRRRRPGRPSSGRRRGSRRRRR